MLAYNRREGWWLHFMAFIIFTTKLICIYNGKYKINVDEDKKHLNLSTQKCSLFRLLLYSFLQACALGKSSKGKLNTTQLCMYCFGESRIPIKNQPPKFVRQPLVVKRRSTRCHAGLAGFPVLYHVDVHQGAVRPRILMTERGGVRGGGAPEWGFQK